MALNNEKIIYFDNASSAPLQPKLIKQYAKINTLHYANPTSLHKAGEQARQIINNSRQKIAQVINCRPEEIIFTSGGTESANLAIFGVCNLYEKNFGKPGRIIISNIEHHAVLDSANELATRGWHVDFLPCDKNGHLVISDLMKILQPDTVLVSLILVNNEIGTKQDIKQAAAIIKNYNQKLDKARFQTLMHTDACQAPVSQLIDVNNLKIDLLTLNGSKIGAGKGIGCLFKKSKINLLPLIFGGGQELNLRSGTENTSTIYGLAESLEFVQNNLVKSNQRILSLFKYLVNQLNKNKIDFNLIGNTGGESNIYNLLIKNYEAEMIMYYLSQHNIFVGTKSACSAAQIGESHVLKALGLNLKQSQSCIRISFNANNSLAEIKNFVDTLKKVLKIIPKI